MATVTSLWMAGVVLMMLFFATAAAFGYISKQKREGSKRRFSKSKTIWSPKPFR